MTGRDGGRAQFAQRRQVSDARCGGGGGPGALLDGGGEQVGVGSGHALLGGALVSLALPPWVPCARRGSPTWVVWAVRYCSGYVSGDDARVRRGPHLNAPYRGGPATVRQGVCREVGAEGLWRRRPVDVIRKILPSGSPLDILCGVGGVHSRPDPGLRREVPLARLGGVRRGGVSGKLAVGVPCPPMDRLGGVPRKEEGGEGGGGVEEEGDRYMGEGGGGGRACE